MHRADVASFKSMFPWILPHDRTYFKNGLARFSVPTGKRLLHSFHRFCIVACYKKSRKLLLCWYYVDPKALTCSSLSPIQSSRTTYDVSAYNLYSWEIRNLIKNLKAVCHVSDWPLQSEINTTDFFVNLCI